MSRPEYTPIDYSVEGWVAPLNAVFDILFSLPFPIGIYTDTGTLASEAPAYFFKDCLALVEGVMYISNGMDWVVYERLQLINIPELVEESTATDLRDSINVLIADMKTKKWMAT